MFARTHKYCRATHRAHNATCVIRLEYDALPMYSRRRTIIRVALFIGRSDNPICQLAYYGCGGPYSSTEVSKLIGHTTSAPACSGGGKVIPLSVEWNMILHVSINICQSLVLAGSPPLHHFTTASLHHCITSYDEKTRAEQHWQK